MLPNVQKKLSIIPNASKVAFRESPSRLSIPEREFVQKQVEEWLHSDIIRESTSSVAREVVLAKKKDWSHRLCVDFRKLNSQVLKDRFPVPVVEEVLAKMQIDIYLFVMDLRDGYFNVKVDEKSRKYAAFVTKDWLFEFNRAPFLMETQENYIVIFGNSADQCLKSINEVLKQAEKFKLQIKWSKCQFLKQKISFLAHEIAKKRV